MNKESIKKWIYIKDSVNPRIRAGLQAAAPAAPAVRPASEQRARQGGISRGSAARWEWGTDLDRAAASAERPLACRTIGGHRVIHIG